MFVKSNTSFGINKHVVNYKPIPLKCKRKHCRNTKIKKEKCLFPAVSHFRFESLIYITSLSGLIKGPANYTHQACFSLQRGTFLLVLPGSAWLQTRVLTTRLSPSLSASGRIQGAEGNALIPNQQQRKKSNGSFPSHGATEPA